MIPLKIFAGDEALAHIRKNGLSADDIAMLLGASGGPKWLSLAAIDRYLISEWFQNRSKPLHTLGTSAGAWRMACYAQKDPLAAHARFYEAYIGQQYLQEKPTVADITEVVKGIMQATLGEHGAHEIVNNPVIRYHTIVARCRGLGASEQKLAQTVGMAGAMVSNLISRHALRPWVERVMFHHAEQPPIDYFPHLPVRNVPLTAENIPHALLATGSIPLVISGVRDIPGAPKGMYRDGGVTDYQFDLPVKPKDGFVLYPHYFAKPPVGGWFDKKLSWRKAAREHYSRTIILAPSAEFAATLPGGRIPDMQDFYDFPEYNARRKHWDLSMAECQRLGDTLADIDQRQRWAEFAEPLPW